MGGEGLGWVVRAVSDAVERHAGGGEGVMKRWGGGGGGTGMVEQRKKDMGWVKERWYDAGRGEVDWYGMN